MNSRRRRVNARFISPMSYIRGQDCPLRYTKDCFRAAGVRMRNDFPSPWKFAAAASTLSFGIVGDLVRSTLRIQARISSSLALLAGSVRSGVFIFMSMAYLMWRECGLRSRQFSQGFRSFRNGRPLHPWLVSQTAFKGVKVLGGKHFHFYGCISSMF